MNRTASQYGDMLANIRDQIIGAITVLVEKLGGRIYVRHYHDEEDIDRNTFFDVNNDGYGVELHVDQIETDEDGQITVKLKDSEDSYLFDWDLSDFNASNAYYLLTELEDIAEIIENNGGKAVTDPEDE